MLLHKGFCMGFEWADSVSLYLTVGTGRALSTTLDFNHLGVFAIRP